MSAYTTLHITRTKALDYIIDHLRIPISDTQLEDWLDVLLKERLYNVIIVPNTDLNNDDNVLGNGQHYT